MEGIKNFLESVSIGGLGHISSTRKYARLFWITIVLFANILAGFMIYESFLEWAENPIRTIIKTKPITELKFPNVTVCPPYNTFTDLNYDMMMVANKTLSKENRQELFQYAVELIEEHVAMDNLNELQEKNRFYNWYHGFSVMPVSHSMQHYDMTLQDYPKYWQFTILTSAAAGEITTQYFGDEFKPELVEKNVDYKLMFYPPENAKNKTNVFIHWNLEKISMNKFSDYGSTDEITINGAPVPADQQFFNVSKGAPLKEYGGYPVDHERWIHDTEDIEFMNLDLMPGFRLRWYYTGDDIFSDADTFPFSNLITSRQSVIFVRIVLKNFKLSISILHIVALAVC